MAYPPPGGGTARSAKGERILTAQRHDLRIQTAKPPVGEDCPSPTGDCFADQIAIGAMLLSWSCSLSAISAMNSELVGLPFVLDTV